MMDLNEYQSEAGIYAAYADLVYPFLALSEEAGEVAGKVAKRIRKHGNLWLENIDDFEKFREDILKELGDVLWQLQECASITGWSLAWVAETNLQKLEDRAARNVIVGSGDNR